MTLVFEKFVGKNGEYYFSLNNNERNLLRSEWYKSSSSRDNGIESVKENSQNPDRYEIKENSFNIKAGNGQIVATSWQFSSQEEMNQAIKEIQENVENAKVVERD